MYNTRRLCELPSHWKTVCKPPADPTPSAVVETSRVARQDEGDPAVKRTDKKFPRRIANIVDSSPYTFILALLVLFSVFAWDIAAGWLSAKADAVVEYIITGVFFAFTLELLLMVYSKVRWWRNPSFWIYLVATAMMIFDIPWINTALFGSVAGVSSLANLRLLKVFRILARLGRLLRIIKSLVLSNFRSLLSSLLNRQTDGESSLSAQIARKKIADASRNKSYDSLERATTYAVVAIFSMIYIAATFFLSSLDRDNSLDKEFETIASAPSEYNGAAPLLIANNPEIVYLTIAGETHVDKRALADHLRETEVAKYVIRGNALWTDIRPFTKSRARWNVALTLILVVSIAYLLMVFNWLISRFSLELSGALKTLAQALEERDAYTRMHSQNVSKYAVRVAKKMNLSKQEQKIIAIAGELHDIGKIGVPQDVLGKPGKLSNEEYAVMKRHTNQGANILNHLVDFEAVILAACHHHEKYSGGGYPDGLTGAEIPKMARILAVCDVWDALTTDRPYRTAMDLDKAKDIILTGKGVEFDPDVVNAFLESGLVD